MSVRSSMQEWRYQQDVFFTVLQWALIIAPATGLLFLIAYWQQPVWTALVMAAVYFLLVPVIWYCLSVARQNRMQTAVRLFITGTLIIQTLFGLLAPESLVVVGAMTLSFLGLLAVFLEPPPVAVRWTGAAVAIYLLTLTLRWLIPLPVVQPGVFHDVFLLAVPVTVLILVNLFGYVMTNELRRALSRSETVRQDLAHSYADLAIETEAREKVQEELEKVATKLERSNQELKLVNEEVRSFAYIISHDLRGPLINLKGFAGELRAALAVIEPAARQALPSMEAEQKQVVERALVEDVPEALAFIDASVTRMEQFINAILKLSRLGRQELTFEVVDMNAVVQATLQTLAHRIEQRGVKVSVATLPQVTADRISMNQIIGNILTNAVDYLDERPGEIAITAEQDQDETIFHIRDNGRGIAAEDMHKLFEPFRRIGKPDVPGEGMGLAYVQTLVRRHGGRIWCESEPGIGTTFTFTLSNHPPIGSDDD